MTTSVVTGGSGYFGSLLLRRLLAAGHHVRVLDIADAPDRPSGVEFVRGDIRDRALVEEALDGADLVFHNVAQVPLVRDARLLHGVNAGGTAVVLDAARRAGVGKVVHTSSSAVFGVPDSNPVTPATVPAPVEAYGRAKLAAEWACLAAASSGLDVTVVRPRTILGHGRLGIFGILFDWVADGADVFVLGDGSNRYQFVHADDLADACLAAAGSPGPAVFNVGADRFGTMREALEALCADAGTGARVRSLPQRPAELAMRAAALLRLAPFAPYHWAMFGRSLWFDTTAARETLGWEPRWSNEEMIAASYDWFLEHRGEAGTAASPHRRIAQQRALRVLKAVARALP